MSWVQVTLPQQLIQDYLDENCWAKCWPNLKQLTLNCQGCVTWLQVTITLQVTLLQQVNLDYLDENRLGKVLTLFKTTYYKLSTVCVSTASDPTSAN